MPTDSPSPAGPAERPIPKTGAQIIVDALLAHGVDIVFGYTGASVIPLFDRLYETPIRIIVPCHEQGGCHMADAYARAGGKVGVMIATSGPGACNLVTGLATAMMDSIPLVAITGQVRTDLIGDDAFQEAPTTGITRSVTKHSSIVMNIKDLARTIYEAFHIASTGRPGPVLIDIPADLEFQRYNVNGSIRVNLPGYRSAHERTRRTDCRGGRGYQPLREAGAARRRRGHHRQCLARSCASSPARRICLSR